MRWLQVPDPSVSTGLQSQRDINGAGDLERSPTPISTRLFSATRNAQAARPGDIFVEGFAAGVVFVHCLKAAAFLL
ncbi:hypothetical protein BH10PLA2_BH10PLA2_10280 [soil metagenome]